MSASDKPPAPRPPALVPIFNPTGRQHRDYSHGSPWMSPNQRPTAFPIGPSKTRAPLGPPSTAPANRPAVAPVPRARSEHPTAGPAILASEARATLQQVANIDPRLLLPLPRARVVCVPLSGAGVNRPSSTPASDHAQIQAATAAACAAAPRALGLSAAISAAAEGLQLKDSDMEKEKRIKACCTLIDLLPAYALAGVCKVPESELHTWNANRVVRCLIVYSSSWTATYLQAAAYAWADFLVFLNGLDEDAEPADGRISFILLVEYAERLHVAATAAAAIRNAKKPLLPGGKLPGTGATAADGRIKLLKFLVDRWFLALPIDRSFPKMGRNSNVRRNPAQPARPFSLKVTVFLEYWCVKSSASPLMRGIGAALYYAIVHGSRIRQAQRAVWYFVAHGVLFGSAMDGKSKHARRFWVPLCGILFGDAWFRVLLQALVGFEDGEAVFRAFTSPTADPRHEAARSLPAPMDSDTILRCIRLVLQEACPFLTAAEIASYTLQSARHVIQCVSDARGEPPEVRVEHGRWAWSTAARDKCPEGDATGARMAVLSRMPDLYSQETHVQRVCELYTRQWRAVAQWVRRYPSLEALPHPGGWEELPKFDASRECS